MFLTCKENMIKAANITEVCRIVREAGFSGIDFMGGKLKDNLSESKNALLETGLSPAAVYGQLGKAGSSLIDQTAAERAASLDLFKERIELTAEVGAQRLIFVPRFGTPALRPEGAEWVLITMLDELLEWAADIPVTLVMEPLNRNQSQFLHDPLKALRITQAVNRPNLRTMVDTYHVHVEGQESANLILQLQSAISIIHISDSERKLPGRGSIDFLSVLKALKTIGFDGPIGFECNEAGAEELKASVAYLKELWAKLEAGSLQEN